jgi:hypothetical protein
MARRMPVPGTVLSNLVLRAMISSAQFFGMTSPSSSTISWATSLCLSGGYGNVHRYVTNPMKPSDEGPGSSAMKSISAVLKRVMLIVSFMTPAVALSPIFATSKV